MIEKREIREDRDYILKNVTTKKHKPLLNVEIMEEDENHL